MKECVFSSGKYSQTKCGIYSADSAARLEIARAMVRNPEVLVMDEATSALDAQT